MQCIDHFRRCLLLLEYPFTFQEHIMTVERIVLIVAGFFIMLSLALGVEASPLYQNANWLWFTAFVGFNLFQSGFTRFCPMHIMLKKIGVKESCHF
jgi:hypothetical protein